MNLKPIRLRIIDLLDQHGGNFDKCPGCAACTEIERLRGSLEREPETKFKHILSKGQDMTKSDIANLLENGVQKKAIQKALKMNNIDFFNMMVNLGFARKRKTKEEVKVGKIEMTAAEFVDLRYKQKLSFVQIAKLKGVSDPSIHNWKERHAAEIKTALKELNLPAKEDKKTAIVQKTASVKTATKEPEVKPTQKPIQPEEGDNKAASCNCLKEEEKAEYERLIAALRNDLNEAHKQLDEKDEKLRNLEQAHVTYVGKAKEEQERLIGQAKDLERNLHDACEDTENEISSLQQEKEELERKLSLLQETSKQMNQNYYLEALKKIEPLEEENKALRGREQKLQETARMYREHIEEVEKQFKEIEDEYQTLRWLVKKWA